MLHDIHNYYKLLNITSNATQKEIKRAYRKKAHELHPDKNKDFDTTEQFQKLNKAYEALSNYNVDEEIEKASHERGYYQDLGNGFIVKSYDRREVDIENYKVNIENLSCNCSDWKNNRKQYHKNDVRRLCRHIIASFDILEVNPKYDFEYEDYTIKDMQIPDSLKIFKDKIISCRDDRNGIDLYWFDELIILNAYIIYISKHKKGIHIFSKKHYKLMYVRLDCEDRYHMSINIESESYVSYESYSYDYHDGLKNIYKNRLSKYFFYDELKTFFKERYYECTNFLDLFDMKKYDSAIDEEQLKINKAWQDGYLLVNQFEYSIPFFMNRNNSVNNKNFGRDIELQTIEKKANIPSLYQQFKRYLKLQNKVLMQYGTTQELLKLSKTYIDTRKFNDTLKKMGFIIKVNYVNHNNWIIQNDGLKFGMNYINNASITHIKIPDWYKISYFDYETLSLQYEYRYGLLKMTDVLWEKSKFNDLLEIIEKYLITTRIEENEENEEKLKIKSKAKSQKSIERSIQREKELNGLRCPHCVSSSIHKKDIRQRKEYQVQRWQCMDCKKKFQIKIEDDNKNTNESEEY